MATRVFVPRDASARSVGADAVAAALAADPRANVVRNGSRGLLWLEPMIEVETDAGAERVVVGGGGIGGLWPCPCGDRVGYGRVGADSGGVE